jgi:hypothetical protein
MGWSWNQPVSADKASPAIGNRLGLSYETAGIRVGKAGHLNVSLGLVYSTRAFAWDGYLDKAVFSLIQMPILGHGPIMGLPWLEAAAGFTPGYVVDFVLGGPNAQYVAANQALGNPLSGDITIGVIANLRFFRLRALIYNSPFGNLQDSDLMASGFQWDAHFPLHWKVSP